MSTSFGSIVSDSLSVAESAIDNKEDFNDVLLNTEINNSKLNKLLSSFDDKGNDFEQRVLLYSDKMNFSLRLFDTEYSKLKCSVV